MIVNTFVDRETHLRRIEDDTYTVRTLAVTLIAHIEYDSQDIKRIRDLEDEIEGLRSALCDAEDEVDRLEDRISDLRSGYAEY